MGKTFVQGAHHRFYTYYYTSQYLKSYKGAGTISSFFDAHLNNLCNTLRQQSSLSKKELELLENKYNDRVSAQNEAIQALLKSAKSGSKYANTALQSFLEKAFSGLSQEQYNELLTHLTFNETTQTLQYTGTALQRAQSGATGLSNWRIKDINQFRVASNIVQHIDEAIAILTAKFSSDQLQPYFYDVNGEEGLLTLRKRILKVGKVTMTKTEEKIIYHGARLMTQQEEDLGKLVWNKLQQIKAGLGGIASINDTLGWVYTEMLAQLIAQEVPAYAKQELGKQIQQWAAEVTTGNKSTSTANNSSAKGVAQFGLQSIDLDQNFLKSIADAGDSKLETYVRSITDADGNVINYTLKPTGGATHGKADGYIEMTVGNDSIKSIPISLKNYNLSTGDALTVQSSGFLLAYLEGAESVAPGFTEHILNIYSMHPTQEENDGTDYGAVMQILRDKAAESLRIQMLYSALSGQMQMKSGQEAEILAIYDKGASTTNTPRVRLYSVKELVLDMIEQQDFTAMRSNVSFAKPWFDNNWVQTNGMQPSEEGAKTRYTKVLYEARIKNISVNMAKRILRSAK